jgi:hypothetical protein
MNPQNTFFQFDRSQWPAIQQKCKELAQQQSH